MNLLLLLFYEFFRIALFTIGGGLAMIPVIENTFTKKHQLLKQNDILDMIGITQTVPGLIAVNSAVFVGRKLAGWKGASVATIGVILPSLMIIVVIAALFPLEDLTNPHVLKAFNCVRACVLGLFVMLAFRVGRTLLKSVWDIPLALILLIFLMLGLTPILIVVFATILGGLYETYIRSKTMKGKK